MQPGQILHSQSLFLTFISAKVPVVHYNNKYAINRFRTSTTINRITALKIALVCFSCSVLRCPSWTVRCSIQLLSFPFSACMD